MGETARPALSNRIHLAAALKLSDVFLIVSLKTKEEKLDMAALQEVSDYFLEHCYVDRSSHPNNSKKVNEHIFWNADLSLCNLDLVIKPKYDVFFLPKYLVFGSLKAPDSTFKDSYRMRNLMITWSDVIWFTAATCWLWITHCTT